MSLAIISICWHARLFPQSISNKFSLIVVKSLVKLVCKVYEQKKEGQFELG